MLLFFTFFLPLLLFLSFFPCPSACLKNVILYMKYATYNSMSEEATKSEEVTNLKSCGNLILQIFIIKFKYKF